MSYSTQATPDMTSIVPGAIKPLFWPSLRPDYPSAWHGHVSFAHWLVTEVRPDLLVELGTHNGVSFAAFCNAVSRARLTTQCYAIDSWEGDAHAGRYGEEVFADISRFAAAHFARNAVLVRSYFEAALGRFAPKSIDVLHIDGLHTYEAVLNDFETWLPKMSDRGTVLFHDTDVYGSEFGVWRLWADLSKTYPHFRFHHGAGLGVLATGPEIVPALAELFKLEGTQAGTAVQHAFELASKTAQVTGSANRKMEAEFSLANIADGRSNLALRCYTLQSSVESGATTAAFGAVDGVRTGGYGFHTAYEDAPWWIVDLGSEQAIDEVVLFNRLDDDCRDRVRTLEVSLADDGLAWRTIHRHDGPAFGGIDGNPLRLPRLHEKARFVRLALKEPQFLHLDQVEVYAPK